MDLCIHDCEMVVSSEQVSRFSVTSGLKSLDPFFSFLKKNKPDFSM